MIRLYGAATGNSRRAAIALLEAGIPFSCTALDLSRRQHKTGAFLALNPRGLVPVLVEDRDGEESLVLTQSNAIMLYAARRSRTLGDMAPDDEKFFERLFFFITEVIVPAGDAFILKQNDDGPGAALLAKRSLRALETAEGFLEASEFMAGSYFTLVDIAAYTSIFAVSAQVDWLSLPRLNAWFATMGARAGFTRGMRMFK